MSESDSRAGSFSALYRALHAPLLRYLGRLTGDADAAEDVAQEAWLQVVRGLSSFRSESLFSTWLHRIAVNCALYRRRRERHQEQEAALPEGLVDERPRDEPLLRVRLQRAMDRLPEGMRRVLVRHDVEGYTHEEIAEMLGVAPGTCKSQLFKARAKMRALLRPKNEGEEVCST